MGSARRLKPRKSPRQRRSAETVEAILGAAAQVFSARGYAGATTNHIAKRAGVSIGSLYQYFPNKDAILVALVQRHVEETAGTLQSTVQAALQSGWDLDQLLDQVVRASLRQHTAAPQRLASTREAPIHTKYGSPAKRREDAIFRTAWKQRFMRRCAQRSGSSVR